MLFCQQNDRGHFPRCRLRRGFFCKLRGLSIFARPPASSRPSASSSERGIFLLHAHMTSEPRPDAHSSSLGQSAFSCLCPCVLYKLYLVHISPIPPFDFGCRRGEYRIAISGTKSGANAGKSNCHLSFSLRQQMGPSSLARSSLSSPSPLRRSPCSFVRSFTLVPS